MKTFVLRVDLKEEEDGRWSASIPTLPGCSSWGYSRQDALINIKDAFEIYRGYGRCRRGVSNPIG